MCARQRLPVGQKLVRERGGGGHLDVLQWARAQGCPWNWCTCVKAAEGGHLKLLSWARANGCPE